MAGTYIGKYDTTAGNNSATSTGSVSMRDSGINPVRESGRFVRANVKIASGVNYDHAQGIDLVGSKAGAR